MDKFKTKVFKHLDDMPFGTQELTELCKPETKDQFIEAVKSYIDETNFFKKGFCVEFITNSPAYADYTAIRKFEVLS